MSEQIEQDAEVAPQQHGKRLDQVAAELFPDFSRSRLQGWIKQGALTLDGAVVRPRDKVTAGANLRLSAELDEQVQWSADTHGADSQASTRCYART